ncbi:MAG: VCBS repeat-containing protein [Bacteroidetes bacterium]|nr:VCBS repeat-containing protein [Bacteroidota bacterium]
MKLRSKKYIGVVLALLCFCRLTAQVPLVSSISSNSLRADDKLTLKGINFGTNAANIKVTFGSVSVKPKSISDQFLEVMVPKGAVYEDIRVTNTATGLSGFSSSPFQLSYGGNGSFDATKISAQSDFDSESGLYDLTLADFDGDGKSDIATANNNSGTPTTTISVFRNTSVPGTLSFVKSVLNTGVNTIHVEAGDINGDGKPEIVVSELNGSHIYIYKNNCTSGTISFGSAQTITLNGGITPPKTSKIRIMDMDLDGRPELMVTDQAASRVFVLPNQSTLSTIQFGVASAMTFLTSPGSYTDGIDVGDFNGDRLPEIVVSEFQSTSGNIFILPNQSVPGTLSFGSMIQLQAATDIASIRVGDLDGDSKPDLAATALLANQLLIFPNQSTSTSIKFATPVNVTVNAKPWGIDFGDIDGDSKTDIAVASIKDPIGNLKTLTVLSNQSTSGNFSFANQTINTTYINRYVRIGDLDNDGRPDLSFTSIDDNNSGELASKVSAITNKNCVAPVLSPVGPLTICSGVTQRITASSNAGATYQWIKDGTSFGAPTTNNYLDVTATGAYKVTLINGTCSLQTPSAVSITVVSAAALATATPASVAPVCVGGTLSLSVVTDVGATDYSWTGPGSFSAHGSSVTRSNIQADQGGQYFLDVLNGTCVLQRDTVIVDIVSVPSLEIYYTGANLICSGQNKTLSIFPSTTGYNFQWSEQTAGDISGATSATYSATTSGKYIVKLTSIASPTCPVIQSNVKELRVAQVPAVDFTMPSGSCIGSPVNFTNQSTLDSDTTGLQVLFAWNFGDGATANGSNSTHTFATAQTYNVKLNVSYLGQSCLASKTKSLLVQNPPVVSITNPNNVYSICPNDSLLLQVTGTFNSYAWSNGSTSASTYIKEIKDSTVTVTQGECQVTSSKNITQFSAPTVTVTAYRTSIKAGDTVKLKASGLNTFLWKPNLYLSDSTIADPTASPVQTTTYTVSGKDVNSCSGNGSIEIMVTVDKPLNTLKAAQFFTPNGDGINDVWKVDNAPNLNQCGVIIYDERGFKIYEAKPYHNDWSGIATNGKELPSGVYYYVFKCDDSSKNYIAGSINIVR